MKSLSLGVTWLNLCFSEGASVAVRMDGSGNSGGRKDGKEAVSEAGPGEQPFNHQLLSPPFTHHVTSHVSALQVVSPSFLTLRDILISPACLHLAQRVYLSNKF